MERGGGVRRGGGGEAGVSGDHWTMSGELGINTRWVMVLLGAWSRADILIWVSYYEWVGED